MTHNDNFPTLRPIKSEFLSIALSNASGENTFYERDTSSSVVEIPHGDPVCVPTVSLNEFLQGRCVDLINMDCEGSELAVLEGAEHTLRSCNPIVFCEIHHDYLASPGQSVDDVVAFLKRLSFAVVPVWTNELTRNVCLAECSHIYVVRG